MTVSAKHTPGEPLIALTYTDPLDPVNDLPVADAAVSQALATTTGALFVIIDMSPLTGITLYQIMDGLYISTRQQASTMNDPRLRMVVVASDSMIKLAADSLKQEQYGNLQVPVVSSTEAAIDYVRTELAKGK